MPTQAPPGYHTLQASDIPRGSPNNPLLLQEFYRAVSNLGTAIVEPQQVPPQQHPAGNCRPDPEIESAIANMHRHERASTDSNNNPQWGCGLSHPPIFILHLNQPPSIQSLGNQEQKTEDRKPKTQDYCSLATSFLPYALVIFSYYLDYCIFVPHVFFQGKCKCVHTMQ